MKVKKESIGHDSRLETLKTPEIFVQKENGAQLLSVILKGKYPEWGDVDGTISRKADDYFNDNPLDQEISDFLDDIGALENEGIDEEALYILALTYQHPERRDDAFKILADHKGYIEDPQIIQENLFLTLKKFEESYKSSPLAEMINEAVEKDGKFREQNLDKIESAVKESLDFFRPYSETAKIDKISLMPTDPLYKKDSGAAFVFGNEVVIKNNVENPDNFNHEFLHCIINPIVEKLSARLSKEQKAKIVQMASDNLKNDYGDGYLDLLSEELIRTYNNVFKKGERPLTFDDLSQRIGDINEEQFKKILTQNAKFKARCDELGLFTLDGFRISAKDYFDRFEKNQLRDLIFDLYSEYSDKINAKDENFEQFISANLPKKI